MPAAHRAPRPLAHRVTAVVLGAVFVSGAGAGLALMGKKSTETDVAATARAGDRASRGLDRAPAPSLPMSASPAAAEMTALPSPSAGATPAYGGSGTTPRTPGMAGPASPMATSRAGSGANGAARTSTPPRPSGTRTPGPAAPTATPAKPAKPVRTPAPISASPAVPVQTPAPSSPTPVPASPSAPAHPVPPTGLPLPSATFTEPAPGVLP